MNHSFHMFTALGILGLAGCSDTSKNGDATTTDSTNELDPGPGSAPPSSTTAPGPTDPSPVVTTPATGTLGATGAAAGFPGSTGAQGATGAPSATGFEGSTGPSSATGFEGSTGPSGPTTTSAPVEASGGSPGVDGPVGGAPGSGGQPAATGGAPNGAGGAATGGAGGSGGESVVTADKFIGNIAPKNRDIPADFADKWMQVSMEANSKWGFVQPNGPNDWVWEPVDRAYEYAKEHGLIFKQHNFFWHFEQPSWVNNGNVAAAGEAWVKAFCERYPDVPMIDVVNEPVHNPAPYNAGMGGAGVTGQDWVITAFQWAKQYCPNSILIINEYNIIEWEDDHNAFVNVLQKLLDAGAPIDAIGAQGHDVYRAGVDTAKAYIDALTERFGLPVYITEMDIDLSNNQEQLASMQAQIDMYWNHPNIPGITYWGFLQGATWRPNAWLVSTNGTERPAMTWLQEFIAARR